MDIAEACKPVIVERGGIRTAFLGLAATLPLGAAATQERPGLAPVHVSTSYEIEPTLLQEQPGNPPKIRTQVDLRDEERLCKDIRRARTIADHVIVGIHWGIAFSKERAEYQQPLGRKMIEAGARLVVGHHPHVRQGLERYQDGVILYSLGDFVFHDRADMTGESGMMTIVELGKKRLRSLRLIPIKVDLKAGLPSLGDAAARKELLEEMKQLSPKEDLSEDGVGVRLTL